MIYLELRWKTQLMTKYNWCQGSLIRFLRKKYKVIKYFSKRRKASSKRKWRKPKNICYECKELGHMRKNCLKLKKKPRFKDKSVMATWEDLDSRSDSRLDVEQTNLYAMTDVENEIHSNSYLISKTSSYLSLLIIWWRQRGRSLLQKSSQ